METKENRLQSFFDQHIAWPHQQKTHPHCTPEKLAAAGFYFCPTESHHDLCCCYACGLRLRDWYVISRDWMIVQY